MDRLCGADPGKESSLPKLGEYVMITMIKCDQQGVINNEI